ncbi:hypothetical protein Y032_0025g1151 [Ancylostoma ceylanicum]|uniref:Uncharacterized protein n=1 Tax=Ancylostoma ceylanicum TaxID=53326 RepID=A0A016UWF9_9BILA|nr:hypothetical protein Y032_0025g1151 [Ancylostoma ceylanicum]
MVAFSWWGLADTQFIISILTMVYYSWILLLIYTSTSTLFRSAFYRIFIVTGFFDVLGIAVLEWIRADQRFGLGPDYEIVNRIVYSFSFPLFVIHMFQCSLMALNRYMAVCQPVHYDKVLGRSHLLYIPC